MCTATRGVGRAILAGVARDAAAKQRTFVWWAGRTHDARASYRTSIDVE